jgi:thiosulfate dehydrogenase (quinone) large subunit
MFILWPMENNKQWAYLVLRFGVGINFFLHGLVRFTGNYELFVKKVSDGFADTIIPIALASLIAWLIPVAEFILGLMLLLGLFTFEVLLSLGILMLVLISGMVLQQEWSTVSGQMVYLFIIYLLLRDLENNTLELKRTL